MIKDERFNQLTNLLLLIGRNRNQCFKSFQSHQQSKCKIQWEYKGNQVHKCSHDPTPSASDQKCQQFIEKTQFQWPDAVDEVALVDEASKTVVTTCYRHDPGRYSTLS